jgi:hypothetical protein
VIVSALTATDGSQRSSAASARIVVQNCVI